MGDQSHGNMLQQEQDGQNKILFPKTGKMVLSEAVSENYSFGGSGIDEFEKREFRQKLASMASNQQPSKTVITIFFHEIYKVIRANKKLVIVK